MKRFLMLIYPVLPQLSSVILTSRGIDAHDLKFPRGVKGESDLSLVDEIMNFNSEVWKAKKEAGISLREEISGIKVPENLRDYEKDLIATHKLK